MHVVIVGGGFAGVKTALELSKRQIGKVTLISDHSYFLHHATLYATATGKSTEESVLPLNAIFANHPNVEIIQDHITTLDPQRKLVNGQKRSYHYDKLVLALGSVTTFFDIKGMQAHAYGIKTLAEVQQFHEHLHDEVVHQKLDKQYFVIGGGLTGVEMASALHHYLQQLIEIYRLKHARPTVTLVEAQERILPHLSRSASRKVHNELTRQGVKVLTGHRVSSLDNDAINIEGRVYPTTTAIWTSGVANNPFFKANREYFTFAKDGRVVVSPQLEALENVYVIGDSAAAEKAAMALPAFRQAKHVAKNLTRLATHREQLAYRPKSVLMGVPVGERWGYVEWFGMYLAGRSGSVVRRWMELYGYCQLVSRREAIAVWRAHDIRDVDGIL